MLNIKFDVPGNGIKCLQDLTSNDIYSMLLLNKKVNESSKQYWLNKFPDENIQWEVWFEQNFVNKLMPRKCKDFNWRLFYGQLSTEARLHKMNYSDGKCKICKTEVENIEHLLCDCIGLNDFWEESQRLINTCIKKELKIDKFHKIGGYFVKTTSSTIINVILTICRWEIWKRRNTNHFEEKLIPMKNCIAITLIEINNHIDVLIKSQAINRRKEMLPELEELSKYIGTRVKFILTNYQNDHTSN